MPHAIRRRPTLPLLALLALLVAWSVTGADPAPKPAHPRIEFPAARATVGKYCADCHSTKLKKGSLDLERFDSVEAVRKHVKVWQGVAEMIEAGEMPPKDKPQLSADEKRDLLVWVRHLLHEAALARAGDPGRVPLRRLSNAEYNYTIRDLTGVDLRPTREFPADGAGGEGFTNAAESLTDISPALLTKYLNAAKDVADHAVLLPDGFRFSATKTRRDWTNEATIRLQEFFRRYTPDGKLHFGPYLQALVRHRDALLAGTTSLDNVAASDKLSRKYLGVVWDAFAAPDDGGPMDGFRAAFRTAKDANALTADVMAWQAGLWRTAAVGSYRSPTLHVAVDPAAAASQVLRLALKPAPGQSDVTVRLMAQDSGKGKIIWGRPRLEGPSKPTLLLRDYAKFGPAYERDYRSAFADVEKYLAAVTSPPDPKDNGLDAALLKNWGSVLGFDGAGPDRPAGAFRMLDEKVVKMGGKDSINGWRLKGIDLPLVASNSAKEAVQLHGLIPAGGVFMHPTPQEAVGAAWTSPITGSIKITGNIVDLDANCGNGLGWRVERRRNGRAVTLAEGVLDNGGKLDLPATDSKVEKGDEVVILIDPRNADHICDTTGVAFVISEMAGEKRIWNLAADVAGTILDANPLGVWAFGRGPARGAAPDSPIPAGSVLDRWRKIARDPARKADADKLAAEARALFTGEPPADLKSVDRRLYDNFVSADAELFRGLDTAKLAKPHPGDNGYGLDLKRFDAEGDVLAGADEVVELRLPAALAAGREFVVDGRAGGAIGDRVLEFRATAGAARAGGGAVVADPNGVGYKKLLGGYAKVRETFPIDLCFMPVVPTDEVVCLKMFHREDADLARLFLDDRAKAELENLWVEHRFISRQPVAENDYLPQFIGFVTQDQPKETLVLFEGMRPEFKARADALLRDEEAAVPAQTAKLLALAARAYRRPLTDKEKADLPELYRAIRGKKADHDEAMRSVMARVFVSPAYLFRIEDAPPGKVAGPIDGFEQATRLSYFLWSSAPDAELLSLAAAGKLSDPAVIEAQARRMTQNPRVRALAVEFGTQWLHARDFAAFNEKNETMFPAFTPELRKAMDEEGVLFFQDLFQADRPVLNLLNADYVFVNGPLAAHYAIPNVAGPEWRRIEGARQYGRGGVLGFGSVQSKQAAASRTSPTLRGNWVCETLLGEKLPLPPADVPKLPEEGGENGLSVRQLTEKHSKDPACAVCHVRMDPYGFALEAFDSIGRRRAKDALGLPVETKAKLRDGTEFDGIDGLRNYLATKKKDVVVRLFCKKLLGYALGRSVALSDTALIDEMAAELEKAGGKVSAAVAAIVKSKQFRTIRGADDSEGD